MTFVIHCHTYLGCIGCHLIKYDSPFFYGTTCYILGIRCLSCIHFETNFRKFSVFRKAAVPRDTQLYFDVTPQQWPIIYSSIYNIGFMGMEKLHPFDSGKWGRVFKFLKGLNRSSLFVCFSFFV